MKNSVFKSNICYLLQLVDYQIWLYKVFKPGLSLENAYFYQMLVTTGIISEALSTCILLDPLIQEDQGDKSLGHTAKEYDLLHSAIIKNNFQNNIHLIEKFGILEKDLIDKYTEIRVEIRNMVHIQNWEGRLYQQLSLEKFSEYLEKFQNFLFNLKSRISMIHTLENLNMEFFNFSGLNPGKSFKGQIVQFFVDKGFGFLSCTEFNRNIYFHISQIPDSFKSSIHQGATVTFSLIMGKKGIEGKIETIP